MFSVQNCGGSGWEPRGIRWGSGGDPHGKWGTRIILEAKSVGFGGDPAIELNPYIKCPPSRACFATGSQDTAGFGLVWALEGPKSFTRTRTCL